MTGCALPAIASCNILLQYPPAITRTIFFGKESAYSMWNELISKQIEFSELTYKSLKK